MLRPTLTAALVFVVCACTNPQDSARGADRDRAPTGIRFLAEGADFGFERAIGAHTFEFPEDHGSHPEFRTEWWYFTGNLQDEDGRHFGFELTFFRLGLAPDPPASRSAWAASQAWMAHFAVTDSAQGEFMAEERFARGALGLAGAAGTPLRVWVETWEALFSGTDGGQIRLRASGERTGVDLELRALKPPVLHGDGGLDPKGPELGNASYYYSLSRLAATGTVRVDGVDHVVAGLAWMDREWGTSALSEGLVGWDWFALQLEDGADLMWYRLRTAEGAASPASGGSWIDEAGTRAPLGASDVVLEPVGFWQSPLTAVVYPVRWRLLVPDRELELMVTPVVDAQEVGLAVRYWEGAVTVTGTSRGRPVSGRGYLELAGY